MKLTKDMFCVYGVTDNNPTVNNIEKAIRGGVKIIQLRMKNASYEELLLMSMKTKEVCRDKAVFIVNDNVLAAKETDADGVHLGQGDMSVSDARKLLGNKIIGLSAHNCEEAVKAEKDGADYIGCGAMFQTETKTDVSTLSEEELEKICKSVKIPVVAIGGVNINNMHIPARCGADGVAVSNSLFSGNAEENAKNLIKRWKSL